MLKILNTVNVDLIDMLTINILETSLCCKPCESIIAVSALCVPTGFCLAVQVMLGDLLETDLLLVGLLVGLHEAEGTPELLSVDTFITVDIMELMEDRSTPWASNRLSASSAPFTPLWALLLLSREQRDVDQ